MRETDFINQNKDKWAELEELLHEGTKDPDKLSNLFIQVTDDLSYSRTFYPNRSVRVYLNNIAQQIFYSIYKNKKGNVRYFINFWKEELPQLVYEARKDLLFSLIVFIIAMLIGVVSCFNDAHFARVILGDSYVDMTLENIKKGDPMGVYKHMNGMDMFLGITLNNIYVSFLTFMLGLLYMVGTIAMLMYNGIMVGVFQYFFYERGLFMTSFLSIWLHGTLEISCIIIASGAGITMGKGLAFPGTYSRLQSFFISARRGIKILIGIIPILVMAAIIESFMTRYTEVPDIIKGGIILLSLLFILSYFVWYPIMKSRKGFAMKLHESKLTPPPEGKIDTRNIRNNGELFSDLFIFYKKSLGQLIRPALLLSFIATTFAGLVHYFSSAIQYRYLNWFFAFQFFNYDKHLWYLLLNTIVISVNGLFVLKCLKNLVGTNPAAEKRTVKQWLQRFIKIAVPVFLLNSILLWEYSFLATLLVLILAPFVIMWMFIGYYEKKDVLSSCTRAFTVVNTSPIKVLGLFFTLIILSLIFFFLLDSPLVFIYYEVLNWNLSLDSHTIHEIILLLMVFTSFLVINLILPVIIAGISLIYFSLIEIESATWLREKIKIISHGGR